MRSLKKNRINKLGFGQYEKSGYHYCEIIDKLNKTDSIFEADPLHSELNFLDRFCI